jgi:hypothetical protein
MPFSASKHFAYIAVMKYLYSLIIFTFFSFSVSSQVGGSYTFQSLNLVSSAREAALGGNLICVKDGDLNLAIRNPSLLDSSMDNQLALNYVNYFTDINYGYVGYSKTFSKYGSFDVGMQYINYGTLALTDETGYQSGEFTAGDYALNLGWGKAIKYGISVGANLKNIYSVIESYSAYGIAADLAASYYNEKYLFTAALLIKNLGMQIQSYETGNREPLPLEIQMGISKRLAHMPFRLSIIAEHLEQFDLSYIDSSEAASTTFLTETSPDYSVNLGTKIMQHFIFGGEFIPSKNLFLRFGYNFRRRNELGLDAKMGFVGFSWGLGIKISKFQLSYAMATYHLGGTTNTFTITTNLSEFHSKKGE